MKKFVQVGCGIRGIEGYAEPILKDFKDYIQLCGVYDINPKRAALVSYYGGTDVPVYNDSRCVTLGTEESNGHFVTFSCESNRIF